MAASGGSIAVPCRAVLSNGQSADGDKDDDDDDDDGDDDVDDDAYTEPTRRNMQ